MNIKTILKYLFVFLFFIVSLSTFAEHKILKDFNSGKAVVLIVNGSHDNKSEQYADWAHYLNSFSSEVGDDYSFHKLTADQLNKLVLGADSFKKEYSMIFIKKGMPSYFYKGAIVEPQVYRFIRLTYSGKAVEPKYLNQFSPKVVTIKFKADE